MQQLSAGEISHGDMAEIIRSAGHPCARGWICNAPVKTHGVCNVIPDASSLLVKQMGNLALTPLTNEAEAIDCFGSLAVIQFFSHHKS